MNNSLTEKLDDLLVSIHKNNSISLSKDDPLLILMTVFEYIRKDMDQESTKKLTELQGSLTTAAIDYKNLLETSVNESINKLNIQLSETSEAEIKKLLDNYKKNVLDINNNNLKKLENTIKNYIKLFNKKKNQLILLTFANTVAAACVMGTMLIFIKQF